MVHWNAQPLNARDALERRKAFVKYINNDYEAEVFRIDGSQTDQSGGPRLSVIIPTRDADRGGCFAALIEQTQLQTMQAFEIIVVKGDPRQGRAINTGAAAGRGNVILILDDDSRLGHERVFENLLAALNADSGIGMAGCPNIVPDDASPFVRKVMTSFARKSSGLVDTIVDSDLADHGCSAFPRQAFEKVGGENELMPRGLDPYLRRELRNAGYRIVVVPDTWYHHLPPTSTWALLKEFYRNGKGSAYMQKFYAHWTFDTPGEHGFDETVRHGLAYRVGRKLCHAVTALCRLDFLYVFATVAYTAGYTVAYVFAGRDSRL
jgi:cellulose synthase/poly-beta-1,6-N-acetylglucosamine synthase-like glycosyltransferase